MATRSGNVVTADELLRLPDDGFRYELVKGRLVRMTPAGSEHGWIGVRLGAALDRHVSQGDLGVVFGADTGFRLTSAPDTVRAPDAAFVRRDRVPPAGLPAGYWPGAPDLVVEVMSPGDSEGELADKIEEYLAHGARLVWIVRPASRTATVHRPGQPVRELSEGARLDGEDVVPGFQHPLADLFTKGLRRR